MIGVFCRYQVRRTLLCNFKRIGLHGLITKSAIGTNYVPEVQSERMIFMLDVLVS